MRGLQGQGRKHCETNLLVKRKNMTPRSYLHISLATAFALIVASALHGQTDPGIREKTFMHTDRSAYLTGETVWFNVYCIEGDNNKPSNLSKLAYVEIQGNVPANTLHAKIVMDNGNGQGYLNIPSYIPSGNYRIRAWTNWMRNFSAGGAFQGTLTIINPGKKAEAAKSGVNPPSRAGFYPEGGHLVNGLESRVAVHVTDASGIGLPARILVIKNGMDTIARCTTGKFGMGSFRLKPESGAKYTAVVVTPDGRNANYPLPLSESVGYILSAEQSGAANLIVKAESASEMPQESLTLALLQGGRIRKAWTGRIQTNGITWTVPADSLPPGVSKFVLFNQSGDPIAERPWFREPSRSLLNIDARTDASVYGTRKKADLKVATRNTGLAVTPSSISVSVFKLDPLQDGNTDRIEQWLFLSSELRGRVESPGHYFSDTVTQQETDLLLLTQGWSRFNWDSLNRSDNKVLRYAPEYAGHLITGTVTRRSDGKPLPGIPAYLSVPGKRFHFSTSVSDSFGRIAFDLKKIYGSGNIVLQTGIDSTAHIQVADPWENGFPADIAPSLRLTKDLEPALRNAVLYNRIAQKPMPANRFFFPDAADSSAFFGIPEKTYLLDDYTRFGTLDEVFREFIPEVQVRKTRNDYKLRVDHAPLGEFFSDDPLMLLDGVPYFNTNEVMAFDTRKIRKIDIVNRHYYQGSLDYPGIINFSSYEGDGGGIPLNPNALILEYEGLQLRREFAAPEYATPEQLSSRQPDFRRLLYWAPSLWTGETGQSQVHFFTGDDKGRYLVVAQGLSDSGLAGSGTTTFEVK